jgi:hypothetical protein
MSANGSRADAGVVSSDLRMSFEVCCCECAESWCCPALELVAQNLIGKAAARLTAEVSGAVNEHGLECLRSLHPAARNLTHRDTGQQQPRPDGLPKLTITVEQVIQAAQTAPRGSAGGPDSIELDLLTHPLLRVDAAKYREAGAAERVAGRTFASLDALRTVVQQFADGDVPADMAMAMFSAAGFAFAKPDGGIRPVACGVALRRLAFRTIVRASTDSLQTALGATQFGVSYPGGAEACKLGLETTLINSQHAFLWIDSTNAVNTICRLLIKVAVTLFVPEWLNLYAACYEIKTKFIIRTEANTAADIMSEEGVHQGCPLGPALFCLGLRLVHLLVRHARGTAVDPQAEGVSAYALQQGTWEAVLERFNANHDLQGRIRALLAQRQDFLGLDKDTSPDERPEQPEYVDPQRTLRAYMDEQYGHRPPGSLTFECALIGIVSQHHAGLVPNIDKGKLKTGVFIPHKYGRIEELKVLFPGAIISMDTPPQERGVKVLGSILRNSHKDFVKASLERMLRKAINTHVLPLLHLHNLQDRYHIMHKSLMQRFTTSSARFRQTSQTNSRTFWETPSCASSTTALAGAAPSSLRTRASSWRNRCTTTGSSCRTRKEAWASRTPTCSGIPRTWAAGPHSSERWKRSFPGLATMCTDPVLGDGQGGHVAGVPTAFGDLGTTGDLLTELRTCEGFVASPSCRRELPCPHGAPPLIGPRPTRRTGGNRA